MQPDVADPAYLDSLLADGPPVDHLDRVFARRRHTNGTADVKHVSLELIDWATLHDRPDEIVEGVVIPGRWAAFAAKAKVGKSTFLMFVTTEISLGHDPFTRHRIDPVTVVYVDAEMGRFDLAERLTELGHDPVAIATNWHATDLPPRLDTIEGGNALTAAASQLDAQVVVIDGINGAVSGAEKDDTTWRAFYDFTIAPLKRAGIAVLTGDNLGKDASLGPRGSSVKVDKPDAVYGATRTDNGLRLKIHDGARRTAAYPLEQVYVVDGLDGSSPVRYRPTAQAWPAGTREASDVLDRLGIPVDHGRRKVRQALSAAGETMADNVLNAAIRWRRTSLPTPEFTP
ncbi:MAG TPA: AAA family ATPase [Ilumatobacter sp.]|nr:AAA family ATPase [Ilumatobacter sp.]